MAQRVAVIINPISGSGGRVDAARDRAEQAVSVLTARGVTADVFLTERQGHARDLTRGALARGASTVVAWGGDGTVNEVASALAFQRATLAIVPGGSGNGLARELGIPVRPARALEVALGGHTRRIDAGELDQRLFFNVAGIGLDARVAHRFAAGGASRRGLLRYVEITAREAWAYDPEDHTVVTDGASMRVRPLLIAIANARQYGNGALIAPAARLDDGRLDVVVVEHRSPLAVLVHLPRVFTGRIARVPGVSMRTAVDIEVRASQPVPYHVDGEPFVGGTSIAAHARAGALRVKVPQG